MGDDEPGADRERRRDRRQESGRGEGLEARHELLTKAAAADPNNADIQNWLGFAQRKQGNLDAAFAAYNKALKLNPRTRPRTSTSARPI